MGTGMPPAINTPMKVYRYSAQVGSMIATVSPCCSSFAWSPAAISAAPWRSWPKVISSGVSSSP